MFQLKTKPSHSPRSKPSTCAYGLAGFALTAAWAACGPALTRVAATGLSEPRVDFVERFSSNQVTIHFNVEANKTYTLQGIDSWTVTNASNASRAFIIGTWTNVYIAPKLPFLNHYVIVDWRTNVHRLYRLRVTD